MQLAAIHRPKLEGARHASRALEAAALIVLVAVAAGCASPAPPWPTPIKGDAVYVVAEGWHVEIGLPVAELKGPLATYRGVFPGAGAIMFGYGKRSFMTGNMVDRVSGYLVGLIPGQSTIEASGVTTTPADAFGPSVTTTLALPPGGAQALSNFIWNDLEKDKAGGPRLIDVHVDRDSLLYAANSQYDIDHTCNTWVVDALAAAGLPISSTGVRYSGEAVDRARLVAKAQCGPAHT